MTALERLKEGNRRYLTAQTNAGDISPAVRLRTCTEGQAPYAVILTCSDSRVIPEAIFSAGIGELFVIRVAGNVIGPHTLGSVEYALEHLGCSLAVVLGHDHCGAVGAALHHEAGGYVASITEEILSAIGAETQEETACRRNAQHSAETLARSLAASCPGATVCAALYHLATGEVEFL